MASQNICYTTLGRSNPSFLHPTHLVIGCCCSFFALGTTNSNSGKPGASQRDKSRRATTATLTSLGNYAKQETYSTASGCLWSSSHLLLESHQQARNSSSLLLLPGPRWKTATLAPPRHGPCPSLQASAHFLCEENLPCSLSRRPSWKQFNPALHTTPESGQPDSAPRS